MLEYRMNDSVWIRIERDCQVVQWNADIISESLYKGTTMDANINITVTSAWVMGDHKSGHL